MIAMKILKSRFDFNIVIRVCSIFSIGNRKPQGHSYAIPKTFFHNDNEQVHPLRVSLGRLVKASPGKAIKESSLNRHGGVPPGAAGFIRLSDAAIPQTDFYGSLGGGDFMVGADRN